VSNVAFYGRVYSDDVEVVVRILEAWIAPERLRTKTRISGEEIEFEDERLSFYCYNAAGTQGGNPNYLLEGKTAGSLEETKAMLQRLLEICRETNVTATFEYVEVSDSGEEISEEFEIR
jgi:hypothetical protein